MREFSNFEQNKGQLYWRQRNTTSTPYIPIAEVTRADMVAFHHGLREIPYQANRAAVMLSKLFDPADDWGSRQPGSNPARRIRKLHEEEKTRYLSDSEQVRLAAALEDGAETVYAESALLLLIYTGCRLNEILTLRWDYRPWAPETIVPMEPGLIMH